MKKRLTKIFGDQLSGEKPEILPTDTPLNVVLKSGDTLFGNLITQNQTGIMIRDHRFHLHDISISKIDVIVFDYPSSW